MRCKKSGWAMAQQPPAVGGPALDNAEPSSLSRIYIHAIAVGSSWEPSPTTLMMAF